RRRRPRQHGARACGAKRSPCRPGNTCTENTCTGPEDVPGSSRGRGSGRPQVGRARLARSRTPGYNAFCITEEALMHIRNVAFAHVAVAVFALLAPTAAAWAQAFPDRPITLIVPWPPGGSTDRHLRTLAEIAGHHLGQPIVVQNHPGAGGTLGPRHIAG